jgi:hypothetical protein
MDSRALGLGIVLALGVHSRVAVADPPSMDEAKAKYRQQQLVTYDALAADPSPRTQILAARFSLEKDDLHLRATPADLAARAMRFAPEDAFVQWVAADTGQYWSSQCGPVEYPDAAVASLVQLEPDNAGALLYAVALAQVKGDAKAVDDALSRMAAAKRADDHRGDEIATWRAFSLAHPADGGDAFEEDADASSWTPARRALSEALSRTYPFSSTSTALENACKPDARTDNPWQRLGYCIDAGLLLARKGNSFVLRDEGLAMLKAAGATREDLADLAHEIAWLKANAASFVLNARAIEDAPADAEADWNGAPSEIDATMRRLTRLGLPGTPPATWTDTDDEIDAPPDPDIAASAAAWRDYFTGLIDAMHKSADVHENALAFASAPIRSWIEEQSNEIPASVTVDRASLVALAARHRDDALLNWIAATFVVGPGVPDAAMLANLQRIDSGNAAAWALSLRVPDADVDTTLRRMAASSHYDERYVELLDAWNRAIEGHTVTDEALEAYTSRMPQGVKRGKVTKAGMRGTISVMFATTGSVLSVPYAALVGACTNAEGERRNACAAIGRLMFDGARSFMTARIGEMLLGETGAFDQHELERARRLDWWNESATEAFADGTTSERYVEDTLAAKSEIEALRIAAVRAGKAEPPADWEWKSKWAATAAPK